MNNEILQKKEHCYGIDLLRIFLMVLIVTGHLFTHTGIRENVSAYSLKWLFTWGCQSLSVCAVDCFILITGYFSSIDSKLRIKRIVVLWCRVFFYSITIYLILLLTGCIKFSMIGILHAILPILSEQYWFFTSYVLLLFLIPFINVMLSNLSDFLLRYLSILILVVFYCLPIFSIFFVQFDSTKGFGIIGFVTLYILGYSMRKLCVDLSRAKLLLMLLLNSLIVLSSKLILTYIVERLDLNTGSGLFYHYNSIFQLLNAAILLLLFKSIKCSEKTHRFLTFVSSSVFGVYLIHEHPDLRHFIWNTWLYDVLFNSSVVAYILLSLLIPLIVFVACTLMDKIRKGLFLLLSNTCLVKKVNQKISNFETIKKDNQSIE